MDEVDHTFRRLRRLRLIEDGRLTDEGALALVALLAVAETHRDERDETPVSWGLPPDSFAW